MEICLSSRFQSPALWPGMTHFVSMLSQNERCRRGGATLSASTHFFPLMATFLVAQTINHLPTMRETQIQSLRQEDPGEGNGNPLQYSCLEIPMDGGTW